MFAKLKILYVSHMKKFHAWIYIDFKLIIFLVLKFRNFIRFKMHTYTHHLSPLVFNTSLITCKRKELHLPKHCAYHEGAIHILVPYSFCWQRFLYLGGKKKVNYTDKYSICFSSDFRMKHIYGYVTVSKFFKSCGL